LEEAGRRILKNYSEKSTNEYKIASETILPKVIYLMPSLDRQMQEVLK
jgi:hypothetical protein